jgi:hypothetical protein
VKQQHLKRYLQNARSRAKRDNVPFNLTLQDLEKIATDQCPVFHTPFVWGTSKLGKGKTRPDSPTLDRIEPELGYVRGNVAFLSYRANRIKDNGTMQDHYAIADWIWNHTHAKKKSTTPVPARADSQSENDAKRRAILTARLGEDRDDTHHHCGANARKDIDYRAQESSGDSVGRGDQEVGTPFTVTSIQIDGKPKPKISWVKFGGRHLFS